jgi:tRNA pseudouridine32 synthase/23S rRNA pseudouridine746 synthase
MRTFKSVASKFGASPMKLGEVLHAMTKLPPSILEDAASKGAVWLQKHGKGKTLRARSLSIQIDPKDVISLFYEPHILKIPELTQAECLYENKHYGVWIKEAGVVSQGTQTGDHSSLLRYVEVLKKSEVFLIHRLDRETKGLMIIGYSKEAATKLSDLFVKNQVSKTYEALVLGAFNGKQTINHALDGKEAISHVEVLTVGRQQALVRVTIETGRLHQIRRHLEFIGHPIMGDPKYGRGNKNLEGLKLVATELSFKDPWSGSHQIWSITSGILINECP